MARATGTFDVDNWEQDAIDDRDGVSLGRVCLTKTFHGEIEGTSSVEMLSVGARNGSRAYVAMERIVGTVRSRSGSFVLSHSATEVGGAREGTLLVVPDSGTGELAGLRGSAEIVIGADGGHSFSLDYEIEVASGARS